MNEGKTINLTVIYGPTTRKLALIAASFSGIFWAVSKIQPDILYPAPLFLWIAVFGLFAANYSETGNDQFQNLLRRYLSFKSAVCAFIGFIMSIAFMEIVFGLSLRLSPLYLALGLNVAILFLEWGIRWKYNKIKIQDESLSAVMQEQQWLIWTWLMLSLVTLGGIILICI